MAYHRKNPQSQGQTQTQFKKKKKKGSKNSAGLAQANPVACFEADNDRAGNN